MSDTLRREQTGGVAFLRLNRPDQANALDTELRGCLHQTFAEVDADPEVRVVVLTGTGRHFCAGVDLKSAGPSDGDHVLADPPEPVAAPIASCRKPVIAAINGAAVGGGLEIALAADMRIASAASRFALTEARIGSLPGSGGTQRLPRAIPMAVALRMLYTGEAIDAHEALRVGLVSDVHPADELEEAAWTLARTVAANAPLSLLAIKQAVGSGVHDSSLDTGLTIERSLWALLRDSDDRSEGRNAFRERRKPRFRGR